MTAPAYTSALIISANLDRPAIWVGCLAAYNAGTLHGAWIEATADADEMNEAVQEILQASPVVGAEEWEIMDRNDIPSEFGGSLQAVAVWVGALDEMGQADADEILRAYIAWQDRGAYADLDGAGLAEAVQECYAGKFDTLADWAEELAEETGQLDAVPEQFRGFIDWERYARDAEVSGDVYHGEGGHTFWSR